MSATAPKPVRSPSYPSMSLRDAVIAVRKIEGPYRSAPVDRTEAAKLIGYGALSGPANQALSSLAAYGLVDRAGKGMIRVTPRAKAILHPINDGEMRKSLREAGAEPQLFQQILEHFAGVNSPPESGIVSYLNRQGFNQSAIKPAVKAFLQTIYYLEEAGVSESHGSGVASSAPSPEPATGNGRVFGGAKVGDLIQWESHGTLQLQKPARVRSVSDDGEWVAVEGSQTGIPMSQVLVEERGALPPPKPPIFPLDRQDDEELDEDLKTDLRFKVGKGVLVKVTSKADLGVSELGKLVALLEAQKIALEE